MTVQLSGREYVHTEQGGGAVSDAITSEKTWFIDAKEHEAVEVDSSAAHEEETMTTSEPERTYGQSTDWKPEAPHLRLFPLIVAWLATGVALMVGVSASALVERYSSPTVAASSAATTKNGSPVSSR